MLSWRNQVVRHKIFLKFPVYWRHLLSQPMRLVGPIQIWRGCIIYLFFSGGGGIAVAAAKGLFYLIFRGSMNGNSKTNLAQQGQVGEKKSNLIWTNIWIFFFCILEIWINEVGGTCKMNIEMALKSRSYILDLDLVKLSLGIFFFLSWLIESIFHQLSGSTFIFVKKTHQKATIIMWHRVLPGLLKGNIGRSAYL